VGRTVGVASDIGSKRAFRCDHWFRKFILKCLSVKLYPMMFHSGKALQKTKILKKYQFSILCNLKTKYHKGKIQTLV